MPNFGERVSLSLLKWIVSRYLLPSLLEIDERILRQGIIRPSLPKINISVYTLVYLILRLPMTGLFNPFSMSIVYIITTLLQSLLCFYLLLIHPLAFKQVWKERSIVKRRQLLGNTHMYRLLQHGVEYATGMNEAERTIYQHKNRKDLLVSQLHWIGVDIKETGLRRQIEELEEIKQEFIADRETNFEASKHLYLLQNIWKNLVDSNVPDSANDERWKRLGFQSSQPATDFRAMGIASLKQLEGFSKKPACKYIYDETIKEYWFPLACVGISITAFIDSLLEDNCLDVYLVRNRNYLSILYVRIWSDFDEAWKGARPSDVMHFPVVWQSVRQTIERDLCTKLSS